MSATLLWFSFRDDAECLLQSVRAARHWAPEARRVIAQDHAAPLPLTIQAQLRDWGCEVETDFQDRARNLNGLEHFAGQLNWLVEAGRMAQWVVKIDSDTLLNAPLEDWLEPDSPHTAVCAWQPGWWFQGPCYALRAAALPGLRDHLAAHPQCLRECAPGYPEDMSMGHLITAAHGPAAVLALPGGHRSTLFHGTQISHYDFQHWPAFDLYAPFRIIHFGNRNQLPPHMPDSTRRLTAAHTMEAFLDHRGVPA